MREINKIAEGLFEKIRDRFEDVSLGDDKAKATQDPEKARFFNFDYIVDGKNYGNITISLIDEMSLKVYFSKNISHDLDKEERDKWYSFLRELREFAKRNLLSFEPRDITRSTLKHRDLHQVSKADSTYGKDEVVSESKLYGTSKSSYEKFGPVRIIVRHTKPVVDEVGGARSRNISSIYVETAEGERFKMPFKSLKASRAMARHISAGGTPHDELGQHITEMATECTKLKPFLNNVRRRTFEDTETQSMVEAAFEYHGLLNNTLQRMSGKKGYSNCKEQFVATSTSYIPEDDLDVDAIKERFVKRTYNDKMDEALPLVQKAYKMKKENKFAKQFESWANSIAESWDEDEEGVKQWGIEPINVDDLVDAMAEPIPLGVDAINATNAISGIINSNELEDILVHASKQDPEADARDVVIEWLEENVPAVYQELMHEIGDMDTPEPGADSEGGDVDEGNTYGSGDGGMDGVVYEDDYDEDQVDIVASAIIRRILNNIEQHGELLRKAGPDGVMNAARDVASFHAPVEELGSSDISNMVRQVYNEVGAEYPEVAEGSMDPKFYKKETPSKKEQLKKYFDWLAQNADSDSTMYRRAFNEALEAMTPSDSASPLTHAQEEYCDACDSTECHCGDKGLEEGRVKDVAIDLKQLTDAEFVAKYNKTKEEVKATLGEDQYNDDYSMEEAVGDDVVNRDVKMKRMGAKPLSIADKFKIMPSQAKAMTKGDSEDDLLHYNKLKSKTTNEEAEFNEAIEQMRKIAGLK